jgi:enterochelin esterase-like enzyme
MVRLFIALLLVGLTACLPSTQSAATSTTMGLPTPLEPEALLARKAVENASVWADGNTLTMVYQGEAETVEVCCGFQESLTRLPDSDVWVMQKEIDRLSEGAFSYFFIRDGEFPDLSDAVWRGKDAPPAVEKIPGRTQSYTLESESLDEARELTVYLPPNHTPIGIYPVIYMADGEAAGDFGSALEPLIHRGELPPVIIVGVHSGAYTGDPSAEYDSAFDLRAQEYLPGENSERFARHEQFWINEVLPWAEQELGASPLPNERAVVGYSNGGVFSAAMGLNHPEVFGYIMAFSLGIEPGNFFNPPSPAPSFYFLSGTLEEGFYKTTKKVASVLDEAGVNSTFHERVAGHDYIMWQEEFPKAVAWMFEN